MAKRSEKMNRTLNYVVFPLLILLVMFNDVWLPLNVSDAVRTSVAFTVFGIAMIVFVVRQYFEVDATKRRNQSTGS